MKSYTLMAIVNGKTIMFNKRFASRCDAINYMFKYYDLHYMYSLAINDEYCVDGDKHNIEYVCDYLNRFRISRTIKQ